MTSSKKPQKQADKNIIELRAAIDRLDASIIRSVALRMAVSRKIGTIKKRENIKIKDPKREKELKKFHQALAKKHGITYKTLRKIFDLVMEESKSIQK